MHGIDCGSMGRPALPTNRPCASQTNPHRVTISVAGTPAGPAGPRLRTMIAHVPACVHAHACRLARGTLFQAKEIEKQCSPVALLGKVPYLTDAEPEVVVEGGGREQHLREAGGGVEVEPLARGGQTMQRLVPPLVPGDAKPRDPRRLVAQLRDLLRGRQPGHQVRRALRWGQRHVAESEALGRLRGRRAARERRVPGHGQYWRRAVQRRQRH
jgi:hypothetical protein